MEKGCTLIFTEFGLDNWGHHIASIYAPRRQTKNPALKAQVISFPFLSHYLIFGGFKPGI